MGRNVGITCFLGFLCSVCTVQCQKKSINTLKKVFHYKGYEESEAEVKESEHIDLGRVVFFFESKPIMNYVPEVKAKKRVDNGMIKEDLFVFPLASVTGSDCKKMVKSVNAIQNKFYTLRLEYISKPIAGLKFSIQYNPNVVSFDHRFFETISLNKGVEFRFYNKGLIGTLDKRLSSSMRVSSLKKKVYCH